VINFRSETDDEERYAYCYDSEIGKVSLGSRGNAIVGLRLGALDREDSGRKEETGTIREAFGQLIEYLRGARRSFNLNLKPEGSPFQCEVWRALLNIPFGDAVSYGQVAATLGNGKAFRAVAAACGKNPIAIFIPCHRVIYSGGGLGGYSGGLDIKRFLLRLEGICLE
jgi:methylated-DNA-[protein]-cysteine S-methyltransferase